MMVHYYHLEPEFLGEGRLRNAADTAIDSNEQLNTFIG